MRSRHSLRNLALLGVLLAGAAGGQANVDVQELLRAASNRAAATGPTPQVNGAVEHVGNWSGAFSIYVFGGGSEPRPPVHSSGMFMTQPDGRAVLRFNDLGCQAVGSITQVMSRTFVVIDVTFSRCPLPALNQRFTGNLSISQSGNEMRLGPADRGATPKIHLVGRLSR